MRHVRCSNVLPVYHHHRHPTAAVAGQSRPADRRCPSLANHFHCWRCSHLNPDTSKANKARSDLHACGMPRRDDSRSQPARQPGMLPPRRRSAQDEAATVALRPIHAAVEKSGKAPTLFASRFLRACGGGGGPAPTMFAAADRCRHGVAPLIRSSCWPAQHASTMKRTNGTRTAAAVRRARASTPLFPWQT